MAVIDTRRLPAGPGRPAPAGANPTYTERIRRKTASLPRPRSSVAGRLLRGVSLLLALAVLLALAAIGTLQVLQSSRMATSGYELRQLEQQRAELGAEVRMLEAEIAQMANVETVHAAATGRLGMVRPDRSVRIAVGVSAPDVAPMPERYVRRAPLPATDLEPWWVRTIRDVSGLE